MLNEQTFIHYGDGPTREAEAAEFGDHTRHLIRRAVALACVAFNASEEQDPAAADMAVLYKHLSDPATDPEYDAQANRTLNRVVAAARR